MKIAILRSRKGCDFNDLYIFASARHLSLPDAPLTYIRTHTPAKTEKKTHPLSQFSFDHGATTIKSTPFVSKSLNHVIFPPPSNPGFII